MRKEEIIERYGIKRYEEYLKQKREYDHKHYKEREIQRKNYFQKYYKSNKKRILNRTKEYYIQNKKKILKRRHEYYQSHKKQQKDYSHIYRQNHFGMEKRYSKTGKGKLNRRKTAAKRRNMKFDIIAQFKENKILSPTHFHHINNNDVIEIPIWLHMKCNNPNQEKHRNSVKDMIYPYLNGEYYNIIDKEKFEEYKDV